MKYIEFALHISNYVSAQSWKKLLFGLSHTQRLCLGICDLLSQKNLSTRNYLRALTFDIEEAVKLCNDVLDRSYLFQKMIAVQEVNLTLFARGIQVWTPSKNKNIKFYSLLVRFLTTVQLFPTAVCSEFCKLKPILK